MTVHMLKSNVGGEITPPPSKSMAHRMLICSALAQGVSQVANLDCSIDINATITALKQLGASIQINQGKATVQGISGQFAGVSQPVVDCAESGSTFRFMIPLFALSKQTTCFTGAFRLFARPLTPYQKIFESQQLDFSLSEDRLVIQGPLSSGIFSLPGDVSSQFVSGLLFALPLLEEDSIIRIQPPFESRSYVELTRKSQAIFGVESHWEDQNTLRVPGRQKYQPQQVKVEGDWSQAAVPAVLAAIKGNITIHGMDPDSAQGDRAILGMLQRCGATVEWREDNKLCITPPSGGLQAAGEFNLSDCPDLGPILCTLGLFCNGTTHITNAGRLRIKESDRIESTQAEFRKLGGNISSTQDSMTIQGTTVFQSGQTTNSHNDHRIVMALSAASFAAGIDLYIEDAEAIRKSWPNYFNDIAQLGAKMEQS